ncbi:MAG: nucleotidyltransferase domain-containing protein [Methanobrevibacter sp.]|jgi:predicted nucleotidyltransferase|nr:nucleotidyltransferase domain-containing protein [Candidatus Methanovirga basalitermitum]
MNKKQLAIDFAKSLNYREIEQIILFGSVAREEDNEDSDIDILIITKNIDDELAIEDDVASKVFDTLIQTKQYLSVKFVPKKHYENHSNFSFYTNVRKDGIILS